MSGEAWYDETQDHHIGKGRVVLTLPTQVIPARRPTQCRQSVPTSLLHDHVL